MNLNIFDVGHGACALLTADNDARLMIDCGQDLAGGFQPGRYLRDRQITQLDMLAITNYDEDHARGAPDLFGRINVRWMLRNDSVSGDLIRYLKSKDGMGPGIDRLVHEIKTNFTGGPTLGAPVPAPHFAGVERFVFWNPYPSFDDENNLSMALFLKCQGTGVMFPGDLEVAGFERLLETSEPFRQALTETNIYVASHHGRETGCSDAVAEYLENVAFVVISDKEHQYDTQQTYGFYRGIAQGGEFRGKQRHVLTTRKDGTISFTFGPQFWWAY